MISIMIVDDHPVVRDGMSAMFGVRPNFKVAGTAGSADEAVEWCRTHGLPDIILSDIRMPRADGFELFARLKRFYPTAKIVFLAGMPLIDEEDRARKEGALGYVSKSSNTSVLADAITRLMAGEVDFISDDYKPAETPFSEKEYECLKYMALGKTREEIAVIQACGPETVKTRIYAIRRKLDANNSTAAVSRAYELGYLR